MTMLIGATVLLQCYVVWRLVSVPVLGRRIPTRVLVPAAAALWVAFMLGMFLGHDASGPLAVALEIFAMTWLATLFLVAVCLLPVDLVTGFGWLAPRVAPALRGWALLTGVALAAVALVQGLRPPVLTEFEVRLPHLPAERDGMVIVGLSDLHLGSLLGERWLAARVAQVEVLHPDLIVLLGDITEGHGAAAESFLPGLRRLRAPLGVWAVSGNHESHRRRGTSSDILEQAGFQVLHDRWALVRPGLLLAGVDDLTSRQRTALPGDPVATALAGRPPGATIFLSHTPWEAEQAARLGVGLMLSGHTHGGQIWPFGLLEKGIYPLMVGRYDVNGMTVIVCRGTGTWGPRMRLWAPSEILRITLRAA